MNNYEVSFTSLCYITQDYDGRVWLNRLADVENGTLKWPKRSDRPDNYFENRDRLYRNDGPSDVGAVGIWRWNAIPNKENPAIDYVQSYYAVDLNPVRVVVVTASGLDDLLAQLREGVVYTKPYFCDTLFCFQVSWQKYSGLLCKIQDIEINDRKAKLKTSVYVLPRYNIQTEDIYNWDDKHLRFLRSLQLPETEEYCSVGSAHEVIKGIILERATWPLFKECVGATKADWRRSKILLEKVCDDSLVEVIADTLKCSIEQAKQALEDFLQHTNALIDTGDLDINVLAQIAMQNEELLAKCEEAIYESWKETHAEQVRQAEEELTAVRNRAVQEESDARLRISSVEQAVSTAEETRDNLLREIASTQDKLDKLVAEIERNDAIGNETIAAVRKKIAAAQADMATFIADLSVFLPQPQTKHISEKRISLWQYECAPEGAYSSEDIDFAETWQNEFDAIHQNLSQALGADPDLATMLTSFLYSAHINNVPILIAGPGGTAIADALSTSIYAKNAGHLTFGNESDFDVAEGLKEFSEPIICVQNMFGKGWADVMPQMLSGMKKHVIWAHPYAEDLLAEPKGLYNYMIPVLSECFVGAVSPCNCWPGKREECFKSYVSKKKEPLRLGAFRRLKLSKLLTNRLTIVLSDAKAIMENPAREKDIEVLFGVLPLCVLTDRLDVLTDTIENEEGISNSVKNEVTRYIEEV